MTTEECIAIIQQTEEDMCITVPPVKPRNGEVFVYSFGADTIRYKDWVADGLSWENQGTHNVPKRNPVLRKRYFKRLISRNKVNFVKCAVELIAPGTNRVLIHYLGEDDQVVHETPHGNRTINTCREHKRTMPSVLEKIATNGANPGKIYKEMVTNPNVPSASMQVGVPRNMKQVENKKLNDKKANAIDRCGIYGVVELNEELGGIATDLALLPHLRIVLINIELVKVWSKQKNDVTCNILSYDTTYNMGDFYVSTLIAKNCHFKNMPGFIIGALIHSSRDAESHEVFFRRLLKVEPGIDSKNVAIVTDREKGTRKAIEDCFTKANKFVCWSHMKSNLKKWLHDQKASQDDCTAYKAFINQLLDSGTTEVFDGLYTEYSKIWSKVFLKYFDANLRKDLRANIRGTLEECGVGSSITTNISEGFNTVMKRQAEWKESSVDQIVLLFHHLMNFYSTETKRGYCGLGEWVLNDAHMDKKQGGDTIKLSSICLPPEKLLEYIKNKPELPQSTPKEWPLHLKTKDNMARHLVMEDMVTLEAKTGVYIVNSYNNISHAVKLHPLTCSCRGDKNCVHILAALHASRVEPNLVLKTRKPSYSLSNLSMKKRGKRKRGRKGPLTVGEMKITPAPDAELHLSDDESLPDLECQSEHVPSKTRKTLTPKRKIEISTPKENLKTATPKEKLGSKTDEANSVCSLEDDYVYKSLTPEIAIQIAHLSLKECDFATVRDDEWLNDQIMNSYLLLLKTESHISDNNVEVGVLDSFFTQHLSVPDLETYNTLIQNGINAKLMKKDIIVLPVHRNLHWTLLVIIVKRRQLVHLCSLNRRYDKLFDLVGNYMCDLQRASQSQPHGNDVRVEKWRAFQPDNLPTQPNGDDCGVFALTYAEIICTGQWTETSLFVDAVSQREKIERRLKEKDGLIEIENFSDITCNKVDRRSFERIEVSTNVPDNKQSWVHYLGTLVETLLCINFKICAKGEECKQPRSQGMVSCEGCNQLYHLKCIDPKVDVGSELFYCQSCR